MIDPSPPARSHLPELHDPVAAAEAPTSAVSWAAVFAGAAGAAALTLLLFMLGVGLGLSSVSPWTDRGVAAGTLGVSAILWITFTQLASSGIGGYLAGRLRTRWLRTGADEVHFRDTAHGFLAWAVATLVMAATMASALGAIAGGAAQAGATVAGGAVAAVPAAMAAQSGDDAGDDSGSSPRSGTGLTSYFVDLLFRPAAADAAASSAGATATPSTDSTATMPAAPPAPGNDARSAAEAGRILANALRQGRLDADDARYLGQMVSQRTGLSAAQAQQRVNDTFTKLQTRLRDAETSARDTADQARKASAYASLWLFISLLIGAFVASLSATWGGRRRDAF